MSVGTRVGKRSLRRVTVVVLVAGCAVALMATSPRDEGTPEVVTERTQHTLVSVPLRSWELARSVDVEQVRTIPSAASGATSVTRAYVEVTVVGGTVDDPAISFPGPVPLTGVPLDASGDALRAPTSRVDYLPLDHPTDCGHGPMCARRFRVDVHRPDHLPPHAALEVRLSFRTQLEAGPDGVVPVGAGIDTSATVRGQRPPAVPEHRTRAPDMMITLPHVGATDGTDGVPQYLTFQRRPPAATALVVVGASGDVPGGVVVLVGEDTGRRFRIPVGEVLTLDPFGSRDGGGRNDSYAVELEHASASPADSEVTVEIWTAESVEVVRGASGAPSGAYLDLRAVGPILTRIEGTVDLSAEVRRQTESHVLRVTSDGQPVTGTIVVSVEVQASYPSQMGQPEVRVELVSPDHARVLSPHAGFQAVGRYLAVDLVDGVSQSPIDLTFVLESTRPTTVDWWLRVFLDPLRTDVPVDVQASLEPVRSG